MDVERVQSEFRSAMCQKSHASEPMLRMFGAIGAIIFILGLIPLAIFVYMYMNLESSQMFAMLQIGIASMFIMSQGAILALLVALTKEQRDTNRIIRRVAGSLLKAKPSLPRENSAAAA